MLSYRTLDSIESKDKQTWIKRNEIFPSTWLVLVLHLIFLNHMSITLLSTTPTCVFVSSNVYRPIVFTPNTRCRQRFGGVHLVQSIHTKKIYQSAYDGNQWLINDMSLTSTRLRFKRERKCLNPTTESLASSLINVYKINRGKNVVS